MKINIGIDPVLFTLFGFEFRWYSMAIMLAIVSGILGARMFHVIDDLGDYLSNPARILDFQSGGLAIYGAVIGGFIGVAIGCRIYGLPFLRVIDAVAPGLVL